MGIIEKVQVFRVNIPLKEPYNIAIARQEIADYVIVRVICDDGTSGTGEAAPLKGDSVDTSSQIFSSIETLGKILIGQNPFNLEHIHALMDENLVGNLYAKGAIDIALHDYCCKILNIPLSKFIGGIYHNKINLIGSIGIYDKPSIGAKKAIELINKGYRTLKVKIGRSEFYDLEILREIREHDKTTKLRLDCNQAYKSHNALLHLRKLEKYEPELIEQPLQYWDLRGMNKLAKSLDTPIAADEGISTPQDVLNIIETDSADMIKLKVTRCGGILRTKKLCNIAGSYGIPVIMGSGHESSIGVAAELHVAISTAEVLATCEMVGHLRLATDTVEKPVRVTGDVAVLPSGPGIGVTVKESLLSNGRITVQSSVLSS